MLRKVVITPRHYLEHSAAILACKLSTRGLTSVQLRWGTVGATNSQYGPVRHALWRGGSHVERNPQRRGTSTHNASPSVPLAPSDSPEYLANTFISFLQRYGKTTELALQCLASGYPTFFPIHEILQSLPNIRRVANHLAVSAKPASCIRLLKLAGAYGHPPNTPIYEGVCWKLSQCKRYALVLEVCLLAKDSFGTITGRLLGWWLKAACELENFASVDAILRYCEDAGVRLNRGHWHLVLTVHLRNRNLHAARQCLKSMEDAGFPPDPTTHAVIAANYRRLGRDAQVQDLALSALNYLPPATATFMINQLLETHVQFDDELGFHQLLLLFDSSVIEPLRILLDPLGSRANLAKPLPTLESVNSVAPDVNTFLISMRFCIARSDLPTAEKIFCLLEQQGFRLSPSILAAFLDLQFALDCPCLAVFITSRLLTKHGLDDLFNRLTNCEPDPFWLWQFTTPEISPSIEIFNVLLRGLVNIQGLEAARIILELMKRTDVEPNSYTIKILIDYLLHSRRASPSLVLRTLRQLTPLFRPSLYHLHPILSYLLRLEKRRLYSSKYKIAKVQAWAARKGHEEDVDPDLTKPAAGLKLEHSLGRPNLVRSLLQSLESRGVRSDSPMLGLRMRYEGLIRRDASAVVDVYNDMLAQGMTPSAYHAAALMEAFTRQGETDTALEVMRSLKVKPNIVMYTILLQGYAHQGQPKAAVQLFQDMISHDIQPDVRAICSLCNAFVLVRQRPYARKLLLTLWTLVGPLPRDHYKLPLYRLLQVFRTLHKPMKASKWKISQENCGWLRRDLVKVVKTYKRAAGLPRALVPSSPRIRRLTKRLLHISRKL